MIRLGKATWSDQHPFFVWLETSRERIEHPEIPRDSTDARYASHAGCSTHGWSGSWFGGAEPQ